MVGAAMGSQTAGSVLRPASFCGVVGFKPSFGRIDRTGVIPFAWSLDTLGTLTRTVADAALLLRVLTRSDWPGDDGWVGTTARSPRLGYVPRLFPERLHPQMQAMLSGAALRLQQAGASVEEATLPSDFAVALDAHHLIMLAEAAAYHQRAHGDRLHMYGPRIRQIVEAGSVIPAVNYLDAQRVRADLCERVLPLFARFDALLVPAAAGPAPEGLGFTGDTSYNGPWTMFGLPTISVPGGRSDDGLPLGVQLVGRPHGDEALLEAAEWCERVLGAASIAPVGR
jgi:amidase